jgi:serine/threonine protein kinase
MVTSSLTIKVIDFGLSSKLEGDGVGAYSTVGTSSYSSEEKVLGAYYDSRDDIWALGCIFLELLINNRLVNQIPRPYAPASRDSLNSMLTGALSLNASVAIIVGKCLIANCMERPHATSLWIELDHIERNGTPAATYPVSDVSQVI